MAYSLTCSGASQFTHGSSSITALVSVFHNIMQLGESGNDLDLCFLTCVKHLVVCCIYLG